MRKNLPAGSLSHLQFSVVGLGDSSYPKYNFVAKKLFKRLAQLGAEAAFDACLCDDQHPRGYEDELTKWLNGFWHHFRIGDEQLNNAKNSIINLCRIRYSDNDEEGSFIDEKGPATEKKPYYARMIRNERVTRSDHWQDVRLIEFDIGEYSERMCYQAGDVLMVQPSNLNDVVERFYAVFEHLSLKREQTVSIELNYPHEINLSMHIRARTVDELVRNYFDLNSIPRVSFFEQLAKLSSDELEKEKLEEFVSAEGREELYEYCNRPRRTIIEIFGDFPKTTKNITKLDALFDIIPSIKPRAFSIASSPSQHANKIQILVAVVSYKTRLYEKRRGTCSFWLSTLRTDSSAKYPIWIKKGSFEVHWNRPSIFVGPGTGVAPFRSIIYEKINSYGCKDNFLYFGCRSQFKDFYFEEEWMDLVANKKALVLHTAFSCDQSEKIYVQDKLRANVGEVYDLLVNKNASVYIAGSAKKMPEDVQEALRAVIVANCDRGSDEERTIYSVEFMKNLEASKRIQLETWS